MVGTALVRAAVLLAILAFGSVASAQSDCSKIVPASPWGPNDQTGATNRVTSAVTKAAAAEIQTGKVTTMSYPLTDGVPRCPSTWTRHVRHAPSAGRSGSLQSCGSGIASRLTASRTEAPADTSTSPPSTTRCISEASLSPLAISGGREISRNIFVSSAQMSRIKAYRVAAK